VQRADGTIEHLELHPTITPNLWIARPTGGRSLTVKEGDHLGAGPMQPGWRIRFERVYRGIGVHAHPARPAT